MHFYFFFISILLHIVCNADCITFVPQEVSLNTIISDICINVDYQNSNVPASATVPNPITFSTQHRSYGYHTATPQYDLNRMSTEQLAWYFASRNYTEADILMSNREIAKHVTAFGTEWILTGQMFAMGHTICSNLGQTIKRMVTFLKDEGTAGEFALATTDGVLLKASESTQKGGGVSNFVRNSSELLEIATAEYMKNLKTEVEAIRKVLDDKVKGFLECANKYLKPEYEHILGINPIAGRNGISKIGGFHHDNMHSLRRSGVLDFVDIAKTETGFYKADIFAAGRYVDTKTFFPAHWSRKEVIEKIYDVCDNFIKCGMKPTLTKDGKYLIKHIIEDSVEIEMYITKNGRIVTAYPVLK